MVKYFVVCLICLITQAAFSQISDTLINGKKYKVTLFDEKEYIGTLVSQSDNSISLKVENVTITIEKDNILSISKDIISKKYKFLITFNSGFVPKTYRDYPSSNLATHLLLNARGSYFFSEKKNVGLDISYISFGSSTYNYTGVYEGGERSYIDFIGNFQIGTFDKKNLFDFYLNLGFGIHLYHTNKYSFTDYYSYDSSYHTFLYPSSTKVYPVIQVGGGIIYKPGKNLGINLEADIDAYGVGYYIFPYAAYFPIKAGISYYFTH